MRDLVTAVNVHGKDGMGDSQLIHPSIIKEEEHAVDAILRIVKANPFDIEIVTLGPVTNIALAIMKDPLTMSKVKRIYSMGTAGFGKGNTTPVAEFNVYVDAEAYDVMLRSEIPITIIGFDMCIGDSALNKEDIETLLASSKREAVFAAECNKSLLEYNLRRDNEYTIDLPDAVAMGVVLWEEIILESVDCYCKTCTIDPATYGQVIIDDGTILAVSDGFEKNIPNSIVCKSINEVKFKEKLLQILLG